MNYGTLQSNLCLNMALPVYNLTECWIKCTYQTFFFKAKFFKEMIFILQVDAPPRSFHCTHCNACILKRDHHCFFSDSCIGFYNQRFFILYIVYMVWGNIWALYLQITYLNDVYPLNSFYDLFSFFPLVTIVQFLLGKFSILNAILMIQIPLCCLCLCAAVFFLLFELMLMLKGVTSYESHKTGPIYDQGMCNNIRSVFGPIKTIPLQILFPLFRVDQQNDGSQWEITKTKGH